MSDEARYGSIERVLTIIECEGFDYTFNAYSSFPEIEDEEFHILREAFCDSRKVLITYLEQFGEIDV